MGSPISPIVANLLMEEFETKAFNTAPNPWGYGIALWVTPLSSKRQYTAISS